MPVVKLSGTGSWKRGGSVNSVCVTRMVRLLGLFASLPTAAFLVGCPPAVVAPDGGGDDGGQDNGSDDGSDGGQDDGSNDNTDDPIDGVEGLPFGAINGNEVMVEASRFEDGAGGSRVRDERFTAVFSLTPTSIESQEAFINDELTVYYFGDLTGQGQLTYEESGTDFDPTLDCPTQNYTGSVQWNAQVTGTYEYTPILGTIRIDARATDVSSPSYSVTFTSPGCPEFDSASSSNYVWQGPGQGVWGFVTIVLQNGRFEDRVENPLGDELGAIDYYEIEVDTAP